MFPFGLVDVTTNKSKSYLNLSIFPNGYLDKVLWALMPPHSWEMIRFWSSSFISVESYLKLWDKTVGNIHVFGFNTLEILDT
ncbi:hypothetical protein BH23THE1_BH23THE1_02370 [soil metagenome]